MYLDLIYSGPLSRSVHIWKIKVPLCIKIFMWFVHKGVILTKDNLMKRNWVGNPRCYFCDQNETIKHLFLECPLAKLLWRSIHIAFNIQPPMSINTLFGTWLNGVDIHIAKHIRIGICALLWAIWNTRNDMILMVQHSPIFCRLSTKLQPGSVYDRYSLMRTTGGLWLLGATAGRR